MRHLRPDSNRSPSTTVKRRSEFWDQVPYALRCGDGNVVIRGRGTGDVDGHAHAGFAVTPLRLLLIRSVRREGLTKTCREEEGYCNKQSNRAGIYVLWRYEGDASGEVVAWLLMADRASKHENSATR
jgi:hypothetical protein